MIDYILTSDLQYLVLLLATIVEGPIATVFAGFLSASGTMNIYLTFFIAVVGDLIGDILYYSLGRWGRDGLREKYGKYFGINREKIKALEGYYSSHSGKTILLSKIAHGVGTVFLFAAGASRMPLGRFILFNFIGTIPKSLALLSAGYFFGQFYNRIGEIFDYIAVGTLTLALIILIIYLLVAKSVRKKEEHS